MTRQLYQATDRVGEIRLVDTPLQTHDHQVVPASTTVPCQGPGCGFCLEAAKLHLRETIQALAALEQYGDQDDDEMLCRMAAVDGARQRLAVLQAPTNKEKQP